MAAQRAGIAVNAVDTIPSGAGQHFSGEVEKIVRAHPDAVLYTGVSIPADWVSVPIPPNK